MSIQKYGFSGWQQVLCVNNAIENDNFQNGANYALHPFNVIMRCMYEY